MPVHTGETIRVRGVELTVHCYAQRVQDQWQAFCLDFDLAAQGDTFDDVKGKLEAMMKEYVFDALIGEDRTFAHQLLSRKAPWPEWVKYYVYRLITRIRHAPGAAFRLFDAPLPLNPYLS